MIISTARWTTVNKAAREWERGERAWGRVRLFARTERSLGVLYKMHAATGMWTG